MKNMKKIVTLFVLCIFGFSPFSEAQFQDDLRRNIAKEHKPVSFPSPDVASITSKYQKSVDPYTGKFNASVPLGSLSSRSLTFPLELMYSSGVKVDAISGWVGNNWSLQLGVINRQLNGLPDEVKYEAPYRGFWIGGRTTAFGYMQVGNILDNEAIDWNNPSVYSERNGKELYIRQADMDPGKYTEHMDETVWDLNHDIFNLYLPSCKGGGGKSIEFVFKSNEGGALNAVLLTTPREHDVTIEPIFQEITIDYLHQDLPEKSIIGFIVTTAEGCRYTYGASAPVTTEQQVPASVQVSQRMSSTGTVEHQESGRGRITHSSLNLARDIIQYGESQVSAGGVRGFTKQALWPTYSKEVSIPYTSTWYLSKVEDLLSDDVITFTYQKDAGFTRMPQSFTTSVTFPNFSHFFQDNVWKKGWPSVNEANNMQFAWLPSPPRSSINFSAVYLDYQKIKLRQIAGSAGSRIEISSASQNPEIINETLLDEIRFFNTQDKLTNSLQFRYEIRKPKRFLDQKHYQVTTTGSYSEWYFANSEWTTPEVFNEWVKARQIRVFLSEIEQRGAAGEPLPPFEFTYYPGEIPERFSAKQDAWGYANSNPCVAGIPSVSYKDALGNTVDFEGEGKDRMFIWNITNRSGFAAGKGASKQPSYEASVVGNLKSIRLPESGLIEVKYELNKKADGTPVGGLRVKELLSYPLWPSDHQKMTERFTYGEGRVYNDPVFFSQSTNVPLYQPVTVSDQPMRPAYLTKGGEVGYGKVTIESVSGNQTLGKTIHYFSVPSANPPVGPTGITDGLAPVIHDDSRQGLLQRTEIYNGTNGPVSKTEYIYSDQSLYDEVYSLTSMVFTNPVLQAEANNPSDSWQEPGGGGVQNVAATILNEPNYLFSYKLTPKRIIQRPLQTKVISTQYSTDNSGEIVVETTNTYTDKDHIKTTLIKDSEGKEFKTERIYAYELGVNNQLPSYLKQLLKLNDAVLAYMNEYRNWPPLVTIATRKVNTPSGTRDVIIGASMNYYSMSADGKGFQLDSAAITSLTEDQNLETSIYARVANAFETVSVIHRYDQHDHVLTVSLKDDNKTSYLWGYNNTLPVAEAVNAGENEIFYQSFEEGASSAIVTDPAGAKTGDRYLNGSTATVAFAPPANGKQYQMSYWFYKNGNWQLRIRPFTQTITEDGASRYDEIRVYPEGALMTTYTHRPGVGILSITDPNNIVKYFEYDAHNRLKAIRDHEGNILNFHQYELRKSPTQ